MSDATVIEALENKEVKVCFEVKPSDFNHTLDNLKQLSPSDFEGFWNHMIAVAAYRDKPTGIEKSYTMACTIIVGQFFTALLSFIAKREPNYEADVEPALADDATIKRLSHIILQISPDLFPNQLFPTEGQITTAQILKVLIDNEVLKNSPLSFPDFLALAARNVAHNQEPLPDFTFGQLLEWVTDHTSTKEIEKPKSRKLSKELRQYTFIEARSMATAISDGRDLQNWAPMTGALALLHTRLDKRGRQSGLQTRFEPGKMLLEQWGQSSAIQINNLQSELKSLEFDAIATFLVCLAGVLETGELDVSIDAIITAINRDTDARRSKATRELWRRKVWRWLLMFDSMVVIGARSGIWKEPRNGDNKRERIKADELHSTDALLKIIGHRGIDQPALDSSTIPKEVSLVAGPWVRQWRGNRELLSEFGTLQAILSIPRGKPSGAWAACIGLMLQQKWREQAHDAPIHRVSKGEDKAPTQRFRPFTRRELIIEVWRSDVDVMKVLNDKNPTRAKEYWNTAIQYLKAAGVIGYYKELTLLKASRQEWAEEWLDQPLDIRPSGERLQDSITIKKSADTARKRGSKKAVATKVA